MKTNATIDQIKVTPGRAEELLNTQVQEQRPLRDTHVKALAAEMTKGNFRLSADALVLIDGRLANGQHRLWAVIESNTTQPFLLLETNDAELFKVIDCGIKRTVGDAAGFSNSLTAVGNLALSYERKLLTFFGNPQRLGRTEQVEFLVKHHEELQHAHRLVLGLARAHQRLAPETAAATLVFVGRKFHKERADQFMQAVYQGNIPDSVTTDLRERLIRMRMGTARHSSAYYLALMIKSFNAFIKGTRLGALKLTETESYPQVIQALKK